MDSLPTGSIQSWLDMKVAVFGPLVALLVGFAGTDCWLRGQLGEKRDHTTLEGAKGRRKGATMASLRSREFGTGSSIARRKSD
jgi:hypothetical protein